MPQYLPGFANAGFAIETLQSYSIWYKPHDYQWLVLKKQLPVSNYHHKSKLDITLLEWATKIAIFRTKIFS
jgi:hypothetical protein